MGKIDYDVGDLVVCVDDRASPDWGESGLLRWSIYTAVAFGKEARNALFGVGETVFLAEVKAASPYGFSALRFRKLPKKSQEFFTGEFHVEPV